MRKIILSMVFVILTSFCFAEVLVETKMESEIITGDNDLLLKKVNLIVKDNYFKNASSEVAFFETKSIEAKLPFQALAITWDAEMGQGTSVEVFVSTSLNGEKWTEWVTDKEDNAPDNVSLPNSFLYFVDQNDNTHNYFKVKVYLEPNKKNGLVPTLHSLKFDMIDAGETPDSVLNEVKELKSTGKDLQPPIVSRLMWGSTSLFNTYQTCYGSAINPRIIILHHTATPNSDSDYPARVRQIYTYHTGSNGWCDIGYNFLVDPNGTIYEGRDRRNGTNVSGAHASGWNSVSVGISMIGDYSSLTPNTTLRNGVESVMAWKCDERSLDPQGYYNGERVISGHRDVGSSTCPGNSAYSLMTTFRNNVEAILDGGGPGSSDTTPPAAITDLLVESSPHTGKVRIRWTAPGDDGITGKATSYELRYRTANISSNTSWNAATPVGWMPSPQNVGTTEDITIGGLNPGTIYFFAIKTADEVPNWSGLSNCSYASATVKVSDDKNIDEAPEVYVTVD